MAYLLESKSWKAGRQVRTFSRLPQNRWVLAVICLSFAAGAAWGQQPASGEPEKASPPASQSQPDRKADNELLAKAAKLYFSTKTAGLDGFDCEVHPDWPTIFASANKGVPVAADDAHMLALKPVRIAVHARMNGGSTIDWVLPPNPDKPLDADSSAMMDQMHQGMDQIVQGFLQFWTPFVDGSVIPGSSEGMTVTHSPTEFTLHGDQNGTEVTEIFSNDLILQHFDVVTGGASIKFSPVYQPTEKGLLVNRFDAMIQAAGQSSGPTQEMRVQVDYATIEGLPIPSRLNIEVVGTGVFNLALDGCQTIRASK
jgi:hypothetical protein